MFLGLFIISSLSFTSAYTMIAGKIYNGDYSDTFSGANVTATCNGNVQSMLSNSEGDYSFIYPETGSEGCNAGDSLSVSAVKGDLSGFKEGTIISNVVDGWDLAIVNIPMVPEFGLIVGALTLVSAVGIFFFVRRE